MPAAGMPDPNQEREQARRLAERYRCGFIDLMEHRIDPDLFRTIPADLMFRFNFVPIEAQEGASFQLRPLGRSKQYPRHRGRRSGPGDVKR